ncbi:hypothetical protein C0081_16290 [Cohaesibacter celericrescens]|uniref:Uncharacterized protein n=1 Tax=Cohaesibacter celericrescens TaxID=2067669 RepID=A0A2N5XPK3_9HYPH|nr:hypothetical protein C0081_16290 [Cohaesibacter celericrescens]
MAATANARYAKVMSNATGREQKPDKVQVKKHDCTPVEGNRFRCRFQVTLVNADTNEVKSQSDQSLLFEKTGSKWQAVEQ